MTVPWTAMPETTIYEDSKLFGSEYEIRFSRQRHVAPPTFDFVATK